MSRPTDHESLDLTRFHLDVAKRRSGGRIIWQPRILCWLSDKRFAGELLPEPYEHLSLPDIYRNLHVSARIYDFNACYGKVLPPSVIERQEQLDEFRTRYVTETPVGTLTSIRRRSRSSPDSYPEKWTLETEDDVRIAIWLEENSTWTWNQAAFDRLSKEWHGLGAPTIFLPRVNVQSLYIDSMGVENAVYAMADFPDVTEAYFRALDESHDRLIDLINTSPIEIINFGDNVHAGTLSPELFKKYVLPAYQHRTERLHTAGKFVHAHWDGDVKPLLPFAQDTGLDGIEAITPKPQGDVSLKEVRKYLGDRMFLIDGIAAVLFNDTYPEEELLRQTKECIDLFAPNLILGISDEISSTGDIERIRAVAHIVDDYNATCKPY